MMKLRTIGMAAMLLLFAVNVFAQNNAESKKIRTMLQSIKYKATGTETEAPETKALVHFSAEYRRLVNEVADKGVDLMLPYLVSRDIWGNKGDDCVTSLLSMKIENIEMESSNKAMAWVVITAEHGVNIKQGNRLVEKARRMEQDMALSLIKENGKWVIDDVNNNRFDMENCLLLEEDDELSEYAKYIVVVNNKVFYIEEDCSIKVYRRQTRDTNDILCLWLRGAQIDQIILSEDRKKIEISHDGSRVDAIDIEKEEAE